MPAKQRSRREGNIGCRLWVPYRLQSLTTERFIKITNKILTGEHVLVRTQKMQEVS
jgi:hypothetical protein